MSERTKKVLEELIDFWNTQFTMSEEERTASAEGIDPEEDWKALAPSEKLLEAACELGKKNKVLDYGCGNGWAGIAAAKSGCKDVACVDAARACAEMAAFYADLLKTDGRIKCSSIATDWLSHEPDDAYDGFICSNVLDVVPAETAEEILRQAARITAADADIVIGMNYHMTPQEDPERNITVKDGNNIYINGILRMVSRSDEEWTAIFEKYFTVKNLDHFAWPGEETERRRLFRLMNKR